MIKLYARITTLLKVKDKMNHIEIRHNLHQVMQERRVNTYPCKSKFSHKKWWFQD